MSSTLVKPKALARKGTSQTRVVASRLPRAAQLRVLLKPLSVSRLRALRAHVEAVEDSRHAHSYEGHGCAVGLLAISQTPDSM